MEVASFLPAFEADPSCGRVFLASRVVRSTDVTPDGRLRFDALARYLQEAAEDDVADVGLHEPIDWVLRRCTVDVRRYPAVGESLAIRTFCSAAGPRWAGRTTTVAGCGGDLMQARAVWVAVSRDSGRPSPLGEEFRRLYGPSIQGRQVSARLSHPDPPGNAGASGDGGTPGEAREPGEAGEAGEAGTTARRAWPLRATDFDVAGHVNNSVHWAAVEEELAGLGWLPASAELEYHRPVLPGYDPLLVSSRAPDELWVWLVNGSQRLASARLMRGPRNISPGQDDYPSPAKRT